MILETSMEKWKNLYNLAIEIKKCEPWKVLNDNDIFAIKSSIDGIIYYASVMGILNEHFGISFYAGEEGLVKFLQLQESNGDFEENAHLLLSNPHFMMSYNNKKGISKEELSLIKTLSFKFRGNHSYPQFHKIEPCFTGRLVKEHEADILIELLEQTLSLINSSEISLPEISREYDNIIFLQKNTEWEISDLDISKTPIFLDKEIEIDKTLLKKFKKLKVKNESELITLKILPFPIEENDYEPGYYPFFLTCININLKNTDTIDILKPTPNYKAMKQALPKTLYDIFNKIGYLPNKILTISDDIYFYFEKYAKELKISIKRVEEPESVKNEFKMLLKQFPKLMSSL